LDKAVPRYFGQLLLSPLIWALAYLALLSFVHHINLEGIKMNKKHMQIEKENMSKTKVTNVALTAKELSLASVKIEKEMKINQPKNTFKIFEVK
jgi:hypothetical protein